DQLIAYPKTHPVRLREKASRFGQGSVSSKVLNMPNTTVASGTREYMPGDKFCWIDWKQTARKNTNMTKEYEQEKSADTLLVLDGCIHEYMNLLAFEAAIEVAVSLLDVLRRQAFRAAFLSVGEKTVFFPQINDRTGQEAIHRYFLQIQPAGRAS